MTKLLFKLVRPAKKAGGDRYEVTIEMEAKPFVLYVPQSISRAMGGSVVASEIEVTFEPK